MEYSLIKLVIELGISIIVGTVLFICINKAFGISRDGSIGMNLLLFMEWLLCGLIIFIILICVQLMVKANNPNTEYSHIDLAQTYIGEKNYSKAIEELDSELKEKPESVEGTNLKNIVQSYVSAKKLYDEEKYSESRSILLNIDRNYINYKSIKEDIDYLTNSVNEFYAIKAEYIKLRDETVALINSKKYIEAIELIAKVESLKLSEEESAYISQLNSKIQKEQSNQSKVSNTTKSTNVSQDNSSKSTVKSKSRTKGKYYIAKFNKYVNSEDGLFDLYNAPGNQAIGFDYIDTETGKEYWFNPASVKADDYSEDFEE